METCNPAYYKDQVGVAHRCLGGPRGPCSTQYKTPTGQRHVGLAMHELLLMSLTSAGTRGGLQEETLAHPPSVDFSWGSGSSSLARRVQAQMSLRIKTWVPRETPYAYVRGPCLASSPQSQDDRRAEEQQAAAAFFAYAGLARSRPTLCRTWPIIQTQNALGSPGKHLEGGGNHWCPSLTLAGTDTVPRRVASSTGLPDHKMTL